MANAMTSEFLKSRGHCCKSNCLHCPYGTTLRNVGVILRAYSKETEKELDILIETLNKTSTTTSSLLDEAFGEKKSYQKEDSILISLKGVICGFCYVKNKQLLEIHLKSEFSNQGISKSYLESVLATRFSS